MSYRAPTGPGRPAPYKGGYVASHTFRRPDAGSYIVAEDRAGGDPRGYVESLGLGTFTMASHVVWSADERSDQLNRFFDVVQSTNADVQAHHNPLIQAGTRGTQFWTGWQTFLRDYDAFQARVNRAGSTGYSTSYDSILTELRNFVDRFNDLDATFRSLSGVPPAQTHSDTRAQADIRLPFANTFGTGGSIALMAGVGAAVVGLVAIAVIATQARAVARVIPNRRARRKKRSR